MPYMCPCLPQVQKLLEADNKFLEKKLVEAKTELEGIKASLALTEETVSTYQQVDQTRLDKIRRAQDKLAKGETTHQQCLEQMWTSFGLTIEEL